MKLPPFILFYNRTALGCGNALYTFNSDITAMAHLGDRLLLALRGIGLVITDPNDSFRILGTHSMSRTVSRVAVSGSQVIVIAEGQALSFDIAANTLTAVGTVSTMGQAMDVIANENGFTIVSDAEILRTGANFSTENRIYGAFNAAVKVEDRIYDHYIAIDWSIKNMAIARMTKKSNKINYRFIIGRVKINNLNIFRIKN